MHNSPPFDVLNREQSIHQHLLLEASAGTGKTFAIEHIIIRLLIGDEQKAPSLLLEKMLVVTFTRAAARDLRGRIRKNLEKTLLILHDYMNAGTIQNECPDYLRKQIEQGTQVVKQLYRRLEHALFNYDQAQIFTIHGFCWRMLKNYALEAHQGIMSSNEKDASHLTTKLLQVVRDFIQTELHHKYSKEQLKILLKRSKRNIDKLAQQLLYEINRGVDLLTARPFKEQLSDFNSIMTNLKQIYGFVSTKIFQDFLEQAPAYTKLTNRKKEFLPEVLRKIKNFTTLFDQNEWHEMDFDLLIADGLFLIEAFDTTRLAKRGITLDLKKLHYPYLIDTLKTTLQPLIGEARHSTKLFARLTYDCQGFLKKFQEHEELVGHNDLLKQMKNAIHYPSFANQIRTAYQAAIIDEFQDTDPVQWEIFASLFMNPQAKWKGYLHLVGDPKQSIYAFRQADIYTYMEAAKQLGEEALSTLTTNFRSHSPLVDGLNALFSKVPGLFPLPKKEAELTYRQVKTGKTAIYFFEDKGAALQLWIAQTQKPFPFNHYQEKYFFPHLIQEILALKKNAIAFSQIAILVSDRYQAAQLSHHLKMYNIPVKTQKAMDLGDSAALKSMKEVLDGILNYRNESALKLALSGRLIGFSLNELQLLDQETFLLPIISKCEHLYYLLIEEGFGQFYYQLLQTVWHEEINLLDNLLRKNDGYSLYCALQDIADLLIYTEETESKTPQGLLDFLNEFESMSLNDEEKIKAYVDLDEEGVSILTTHMSKGLEFDIVFALGLSNRPKQTVEKLILLNEGTEQRLGAVDNAHDPRYLAFCMESDAEKMRQLYVALTRAKYRLYIPIILSEQSNKSIELGTASPLDLFLARFNQQETNYLGIYERLNQQDGSALSAFIEQTSDNISLKFLEPMQKKIEETYKKEETFFLVPPSKIEIKAPSLSVQSFTSLTHQLPNSQTYPSAFAVSAPHEFNPPLKNSHTMPAGAEIGIILHHIFETIPFQLAKNTEKASGLLSWIEPSTANTSFASWNQVIAEMVYKSLTTPLPQASFCLADISSHKMYRESEFLYAYREENFSDISQQIGYLKGVVDLLFEHNGLYYLLDWKSNWLGPTIENYHVKDLEMAMVTNQYFLQAEIYTNALKRYLALFNSKPFEEIFGGIYYVFMRGVGQNTGILLHQT